MSHNTTRERIPVMQNETRQTTPAAAFSRSSIKRLPAKLREAVDQAIADGDTIDEITARIRAEVEGRPPPAPRTVTSVPVDPWNPAEFPAVPVNPGESHSIPDNPGESHLSPANHYESWTEIAPRVYRTSPTSILSLGPAEARVSNVFPDTPLDPLPADRTPGRDPGEKSGFIPPDPCGSRPKNEPAASRHIAHSTWPCPPPL